MSDAVPLSLATDIARRFGLEAEDLEVTPLGRGLINDSFLVQAATGRWVLQRLNGRVFPDPEGIMANLARLGAHLDRQPGLDLAWPTLRPLASGATWTRDAAGGLWRMMSYLPGQPLARIANPGQAAEVGRLLGQFHRAVADLEPAHLRVTLPGFHVTPAYLHQFDRVLAATRTAGVPLPTQGTVVTADTLIPVGEDVHAGEAGSARPAGSITGSLGSVGLSDSAGSVTRVPTAEGLPSTPDLEEALDFFSRRRDGLGELEDARRLGLIPERVVHGDPKLDNLLFDVTGERALALIDLDTVQPGLTLHDIADCLRSCCNRQGEAAQPTAIVFDLGVCRPLLSAYATVTRGLLTPTEVALLYPAIRLLPLELGLRFLTDHLQGDRWFRVTAPGQNLSRARVQFALVASIERQEAPIREAVAACYGDWPCQAALSTGDGRSAGTVRLQDVRPFS